MSKLVLAKAIFRTKWTENLIKLKNRRQSSYVPHKTTLITIGLIPPAALYYDLPKNQRRAVRQEFSDYLYMIGYGLWGGDLENRLKDENESIGTQLKLHKSQKWALNKAHELADKYGVGQDFRNAEQLSRRYETWENEQIHNFQNKRFEIANQLFKEYIIQEIPKIIDYAYLVPAGFVFQTPDSLLYGRIAVLYQASANMANKMWLKDTDYAMYADSISTWASLISGALQLGLDDLNDLNEDLKQRKPTLINLFATYFLAKDTRVERFFNGYDTLSIKHSIKFAKDVVDSYFNHTRTLDLPSILQTITEKVQDKVNNNFAQVIESI